ncbi:MAG: plastocyanin/azurin family copper-binding protein [Planctomycetota bacterium]
MSRIKLFLAAASALWIAPIALAANVTVTVSNFSFAPAEVTIDPGDTVTWQWSAGTHTITSGVASSCATAGSLFDSPSDFAHQSFVFAFSNAGSFPYFCRIHEAMGMTGIVKVRGLTFNGTPSQGNMVNFTVASLPSSDDGAKALVLLSVTGSSPGISLGGCVPVIGVTLDSVTLLGLSVAPVFTTGVIVGGTASTPAFPFPSAPANLTVFAAAAVINFTTGAVGSVLPTITFVTQ